MLQSNPIIAMRLNTAAALAAVLFTLVSGAAVAQQAGNTATPAANPDSVDIGSFYIPYGNLKDAASEDVARARKVGEDLASDLLGAYEKRGNDPTLQETMGRAKVRADDIADAAMSADRDKVLDFLGIDPQRTSNLYYFVSWSMPLEMLRSYAIEAMWSGGTLIFKGVPPGKNFGVFLGEDFSKLTYGKGASANVSIDPRLYDAYGINSVPSIVLTSYRAEMECIGVNPVPFKYQGKTLSYDTCPPLDETKYTKVSGAVTSSYALQLFIDNGEPAAKTYLKALGRGFATGQLPGKEQKPFAGKWEEVISPSERMAAEEAARAIHAIPRQQLDASKAR